MAQCPRDPWPLVETEQERESMGEATGGQSSPGAPTWAQRLISPPQASHRGTTCEGVK